MACSDRFRLNDQDYTTFSSELRNRFVETGRIERPGRPWPTRLGFYRWWSGDFAAVHLRDSLPWTLVEVRLVEYLEDLDAYRVVIDRFDGHRQTLAGLSLGDELVIQGACFFAVWGPDETRDDGEGAQKVYAEGTAEKSYQLPEDSDDS